MEDDNKAFEKTKLNSVGRHKERGVYDKETIAQIIREAKIVHVSFVDDQGRPQCIPLIGALEEDDGQMYLYLHGYVGARFIKALSDVGTPMVATATILDGYVLALSAFSHSMNYRSVVLHGVSYPLAKEDTEAKKKAFQVIVEAATPGRWENSRQPDPSEYRTTGVVRMKVESGSAKVRKGGPKDERKDMDNAELLKTTWTGVVPVKSVTGAPIPSDYAPKGPIPEHVLNLTRGI